MEKYFSILVMLLSLDGCFAAASGCKKISNSTSTTVNKTDTGFRYLAPGDSYTIGQSVPETDRFPHQPVALLKQQNINFKFPKYIAVTGWNTSFLLNEIANRKPRVPYNIVTLFIGVNDGVAQYYSMQSLLFLEGKALLIHP